MKTLTRFPFACIALLLGGCGGGDTEIHQTPDQAAAYEDGELLVKFKPGVGKSLAGAMHGWVAAAAVQPLGMGIERVTLPPGMSVESAQQRYQANPAVAYAEPNYRVYKAATVPDDTHFALQWTHQNSGQTVSNQAGTAGADIRSTLAWDLHHGNGSVTVAVIDTGVDYAHPDLQANIWTNPNEIDGNGLDDDGNGYDDDVRGWNFVSNNNSPMDDDIDGHGSHIAGIIGAAGNNGVGVSGVNWSVRIMPLKFLDADGSGSMSDVILAIQYAVDQGARVINASYAHPQSCSEASPHNAERDAIAWAGRHGVLFVAAAGNYTCNNDDFPTYPASYRLPNLLSVTATDARDQLAYFSNYGQSNVHLAAPGVNIYSTVRRDLGSYGLISGTSMAAPVVSGLAALLMSYKPTLSLGEVRETLLKAVDSKAALTNKVASGGRVNAFKALSMDLSTQAPFPPSNLSAASVGNSQIHLDWLDNSGIETGILLERKSGANGNFATLATLPADSQAYIDSSVHVGEGSAYSYRLKASNAQGESGYSAITSMIVKLYAPAGLSVSGDSQARMTLVWQDLSGAESAYEIERKTDAGGYEKIGQTAANTETYIDTIHNAGTYSYRVRANNPNTGPSAYSNAVSVTVSFESSDSRCFIATAAYGAAWQPQVTLLRQFRDRYLLSNAMGRAFVRFYYWSSPPLARTIARHDSLRAATRLLLTPVVWTATLAMAQKPEARPTARPGMVAGELLVKFKPGTSRQQAEAIITGQGDSVVTFIDSIAVFHIRIHPGRTAEQAMQDYAAMREVQYAEPNMQVRIQQSP